jgi:hypothetical protein
MIGRVAGINLDKVGQKKDVKYLKDKSMAKLKTVAHMMECSRKNRQNVDSPAQWTNPAIKNFSNSWEAAAREVVLEFYMSSFSCCATQSCRT